MKPRPRNRSLIYICRLTLVSGHGRLVVGEHDGLPHPTTVRLALLPNDVLPDELLTATDADMLLLRLHARQALARAPRQRRESTRKTTRYEAGARGRRRFRVLLVPYTSKCCIHLRNEG